MSSETPAALPATAALKLVVSDLHLGDGDPLMETWRAPQQAAWERLLRGGVPADSPGVDPIELIVNGDCFDFLATAPALTVERMAGADTALPRIERILAAHGDWLTALRAWLGASGGIITFLIGNHDAELALGAVRARIRAAIGAAPGAVRFCLERVYQPLPDVVIEHGCQFDPWNRIRLWDGATHGAPAEPVALEAFDARGGEEPTEVELPWGSRYYYRVMLPIVRRFSYLTTLHPPISQTAGLALLCLYAPDLVRVGARHVRSLREEASDASNTGDTLASNEGSDPATLFQAVLREMAALRAQVWRHAGAVSSSAAMGDDQAEAEALARALATGELSALRAIFARPAASAPAIPEEDAVASAAMFGASPAARIALCGHTHVEGDYQIVDADGAPRRFLNTGTWYPRLAWPEPTALDAATLSWLRDPLARPSPLASATAFTYALLRASPGQPTRAELREV